MVSGIVVFTTCVPEVPAIVSVLVPTCVVLPAISVSWVAPVAGFGEMEAVTPLGKPVTARFTLPVKPYSGVTQMDWEPVAP